MRFAVSTASLTFLGADCSKYVHRCPNCGLGYRNEQTEPPTCCCMFLATLCSPLWVSAGLCWWLTFVLPCIPCMFMVDSGFHRCSQVVRISRVLAGYYVVGFRSAKIGTSAFLTKYRMKPNTQKTLSLRKKNWATVYRSMKVLLAKAMKL